MYLSKLVLNPRVSGVRQCLNDPYGLHRCLLNAFPADTVHRERTAADAAGILYRLDADSAEPSVLVQSQQLPDWTLLPTNFLLPMPSPNPAVKQVNPEPAAGQVLAFRLVANPTKRPSTPKGEKDGKRIGLYTTDAQLAWLTRKSKAAGFNVLDVQVRELGKAKSVVNGKSPCNAEGELRSVDDEPRRITHNAQWFRVQFDGLLQVTDPALLRQAVAAGIGSAKGFGCGLLSLAPARMVG